MTGIAAGALLALSVALVGLVLRVRASETRARQRGAALEAAERVARVGSFRLDLTSWDTLWSGELFRLQGLKPGECKPDYEHFLRSVHPQDRDAFDHIVRSSVRGGRPFALDCRMVVRGRGERIMHCRGETLAGRDGRPTAVVGTVQDVTEMRHAEAEIAHRVLHDPVTDVANREAVAAAIDAQLAEQQPVAALVVNVRGFRGITRTLGHEIGDRLLRSVADRLRGIAGTTGIGRLGGDRFVLVVEDATDLRAVDVAHSIASVLEPPFELDGFTLLVEASVGIAVAPRDADGADELLRAAQAATERAAERRQSYAVFDAETDARGHGAHALLAAVRSAIANGELVVHYQPKLALDGRGIVGVEALVRWRRDGQALIPPGDFLPQVERSGLIRELTLSVLDTAVRDCAAWGAQGLDLGVAINLSSANLLDMGIADDVAGVLARHGLPPHALELEVTESALMIDRAGASGVIAGLRAMGASLAIDDFGTGYSSLALLREMQLDTVKIDRSFVSGMESSPGDGAIVRSVVSLARELGLTAVAEGVENAHELATLSDLGCDQAQGFLIARPVPADELPAAIEAWNSRERAL